MGQGDELLGQLGAVPDERYEKAAANLIKSKGKNRKKALLLAGFPLSVAAHSATDVINDPKFVAALMKLGVSMTPQQIGQLSQGSMIQLLSDPKLELRTRVQVVRLGLEVAGITGQNSINLHMHGGNLPSPMAIDMVAKRMLEIQKNQDAITVEAVNADAS